MSYILITGFDATNGGLNNPAATLAFHLQQLPTVKAAILPTVYEACDRELHRLLYKSTRQRGLAGVVMLGQAGRKPAIYLETQVKNRSSPTREDGMGKVGPTPLYDHSPGIYKSTLPISQLEKMLLDKNIPVKQSSDAGDYLCNFAAYTAARMLEDEKVPHGFVHIPSVKSTDLKAYEPGGWVYRGVETIVTALAA